MNPIICENNGQVVASKIKEFLQEYGIIKDICIVDSNNSQIVLLLDHASALNEKDAKIWWNGYSEGMKAALA